MNNLEKTLSKQSTKTMSDLYKARAKLDTGGSQIFVFYKPTDYRGYVRFTMKSCNNIKHHQKLPQGAEGLTDQDLTKSVMRMLDFLDEKSLYMHRRKTA